MKKYNALCAEDISFYGFTEIDAADDAEAIAKARALAGDGISQIADDADWGQPHNQRICHIEGPDGEDVAMDIDLDQETLALFAELDAILDAGSDLQAAIDGVTDQFDEEVERLEKTSLALSLRLKQMRGQS